jgi:Fe(II)/alpha-ketoglutarate-dependent arginine beta-hydroxylase
MNRVTLTSEENASTHALLDLLTSKYSSVEDPDFLREASVYAHELPRRIRSFLNDFKLSEQSPGICLISGYSVDDKKLGKTPQHWKDKSPRSRALEEEMLLVLYGSLLGDVFGWATEQDGHIVHDVFPIKGNEDKQISTSSEQTIWWHTEDAFHAFSGDYVGMFCLRNSDQVATTFASLDEIHLRQEHIEVLFEPRYIIRPDISHQQISGASAPEQAEAHDESLHEAQQRIQQMESNPEKVAVLFGHSQSPYLRIDPYFMPYLEEDKVAQQALEALIESIDDALWAHVLQPGDCCMIDNCRTVHGRQAFKPRYDGTDRWLKRTCVTRDLRKSRRARNASDSRIIF